MTVGSTTGMLRIGKVCDQLREEFPDISVSKLRFLADKGIVEPSRTQSGYRMYSTEQVEAIRHALRMQRDEFLPLRVIREELQQRIAASRSESANTQAPQTLSGVISDAARRAGRSAASAARVDLTVPEALLDLAAVCSTAGVDREFVEECRSNDIITGQRSDDGNYCYSPDETQLVKLAGSMHQLGVDVRHLRQSSAAMSRQGALIEQIAATVLRAPGDAARQQAIAQVEALTQQLAEFMRIAFISDVRDMTERITGVTAPRQAGSSTPHAAGLL